MSHSTQKRKKPCRKIRKGMGSTSWQMFAEKPGKKGTIRNFPKRGGKCQLGKRGKKRVCP